MAQQTINVGTVAGDNTGDPGRTAFTKINDNFNELYSSQIAGTGYIQLSSVAGTNTITATASASFAAYAANQLFAFVAAGTNTGATTINVSAKGAKTIQKIGGTALVAGDIVAGSAYLLVYDGANMQLITQTTVQTSQIQALAVTAAKIANNTITATQIANNAVGTSQMATASVTPAVLSNSGYELSFRNRFINAEMAVDQRNGGATQTFIAGSTLAYCVDRWYGYCTGANVTAQRGASIAGSLNSYVFAGAASVTGIGFAQRIERSDSLDLAGQTATLSVYTYNTALTTVSWAAYYATTNDAFGTLASPTRTLISSGTFTVTSSVARYSATISVPAAATTGIEIVFSVGAQTSGIWVIAGAQLEIGANLTPLGRVQTQTQFARCQRFFQNTRISGGGTQVWTTVYAVTTARLAASTIFPVQMRATPTVGIYSPVSDTLGSCALYNAAPDVGTGAAAQVVSAAGFSNFISFTGTPLTAGSLYSHTYQASAEL